MAQPHSPALQACLVFLIELCPAPTHARWPRCSFCTYTSAHTAIPILHLASPASHSGFMGPSQPPCLRPSPSPSGHCSSQGCKLQAAATIPSSSLSDPQDPHRIGSWGTFAQRKKTRARTKDPGSLYGVTGVPIILKVTWFDWDPFLFIGHTVQHVGS